MVFLWIFLAVILLLVIAFLFSIRGRRGHALLPQLRQWHYAHRGLHNEARPENSMSAFRAALEKGYGIELDVHLMRDGNLAVIHDSLLNRTTGQAGRVEDLTTEGKFYVQILNGQNNIAIFRIDKKPSLLNVVLGIGSISEGIADDIEGNGDDQQHGYGEEQLVAQGGHRHQGAAGLDQIAQRGGVNRQADADVGDEHLVADGGGDGQRHPHGDDGHQIRKQVFHDDPSGGDAQAPGGQIVVPVTDNNDLVADKPRHAQPAGQAHREDQRPEAGL